MKSSSIFDEKILFYHKLSQSIWKVASEKPSGCPAKRRNPNLVTRLPLVFRSKLEQEYPMINITWVRPSLNIGQKLDLEKKSCSYTVSAPPLLSVGAGQPKMSAWWFLKNPWHRHWPGGCYVSFQKRLCKMKYGFGG